jgi:hypothetical protein
MVINKFILPAVGADLSFPLPLDRPFRWIYPCPHLVVKVQHLALVFILLCLAVFLTGCGSGDQQQLDPRLKSFHILSSRIIMLDNQAEVDGTIQNSGHDRYPFDVTIYATFYDKAGDVIGQAVGVAEDVLPGMSRTFVLMGQVDSLHYNHMGLAPVSLQERRKEPNLPTPPPVSP